MPRHPTVEDTIHDFEAHQITEVTFTDTETIVLYIAGEHTSATFKARVTDGTNTAKVICEIFDDGTSVEIDIREIVIGTLDLNVTVAENAGNIELSVKNNDAVVTNTLRYYVILSDL